MTLLELEPATETRGSLRGPPRWPPTARGAGPRPPDRPRPPFRFHARLPRRHSRARRIVLGVFALVFGLGALPIITGEGVARVAAVTSLAASVDAGVHAATGSLHPWREVVGPAAWRILRDAAMWSARFGKRRGVPDRLARALGVEDLLNPRALARSSREPPDDGGDDAA